MDSRILAFEMPGMDVQIHRHAGFQIVYALEQSFNTEVSGQRYAAIRGFVIRPQLAHACSGVAGKFAIVNVEADSFAGRNLDTILGNKPLQLLHHPEDLYTLLGISGDANDAIYATISYLRSVEHKSSMDERVQRAVEIIRAEGAVLATPAALAEAVHLSPSRLAALFKEQTGSSLSKFILWTRLRRAIIMLITSKYTLSEIAAETGSYDSPNFTKYMHQMIGVPPIAFRKKSDLIQVL